MDRFRFIHAADIHLDSPLRGLERYEGAPVDEIRNASRRAFVNLVNLAIDEHVAFVLIAGDLYDGDWKDYHTGLFLVAQMAQLREANIPVIVIKGNHDAANKMTLQLSLPDNVRMLDHKRAETVRLDDLGVAIHGQSFARQEVNDDLSQNYPAAIGGLLNLGILHTCATGSDIHARYAPCTIDGLRSKGYDYWALGHIHKPERLCTDPYILFSGNLQGRHIGESGAKGCVLVDVEEDRIVAVEAQPLDVFRWQRCWVDASGAKSSAEVLERIRWRIETLLDDAGDRSLAVRVELAGACPAHREIAARPEQWIAEVRAVGLNLGSQVWIEKVQNATSLPVDLAEAMVVDGPLGELARFVAELRSDPEKIARLLGDDLVELRKKLPADLLGRATESNSGLPGGAAVNELLEQVEQMLVAELSAAGRSGETP